MCDTKVALQQYLQKNANGGKKVSFTIVAQFYDSSAGCTTTTLAPDMKTGRNKLNVILVEEAFYGTLQNVTLPE